MNIENRPFRVEQLIATAEAFYSVSRLQILRADRQTATVKTARAEIARTLIRDGFTTTQVGRWLNYRDHTTVVYLIRGSGAIADRVPKISEAKPVPVRHPRSFVALMAAELRKRALAPAAVVMVQVP